MSNGDEIANEYWRAKYLKMLEHSFQILESNRVYHAKVKRINKNVRRVSRQNQYFVHVLKNHGDDFGLHCPSVWEKIAYPGAISEPLLDAKAQMKKPPNAFFLYCKENRDSVKKLIREQPAGMYDARNEITRQLAKDWNALPQEEREKYFEKYRDNIEQYEESIREERRKNKLMFAMSSSDEDDEEEQQTAQTPSHFSQTPSHPFQTPSHPFQTPSHPFQTPSHLFSTAGYSTPGHSSEYHSTFPNGNRD